MPAGTFVGERFAGHVGGLHLDKEGLDVFLAYLDRLNALARWRQSGNLA